MPSKPKKIPMRMCVSCREMKPKRELLRIVVPAGSETQNATLDAGGRVSGRGAYLCRSAECLARAKKSRAVERALSCEISEATWQLLESEAQKTHE